MDTNTYPSTQTMTARLFTDLPRLWNATKTRVPLDEARIPCGRKTRLQNLILWVSLLRYYRRTMRYPVLKSVRRAVFMVRLANYSPENERS